MSIVTKQSGFDIDAASVYGNIIMPSISDKHIEYNIK